MATATSNGNVGKVTQVIGSTLDAEYPEDKMPRLYNALHVNVDRKVGGQSHTELLTCEVASHLGGGRVRAVAGVAALSSQSALGEVRPLNISMEVRLSPKEAAGLVTGKR